MEIVKLKGLPRWDYTSPMTTLDEQEAILWAEGRGAKVLYWCIPMDKYLIEVKDD